MNFIVVLFVELISMAATHANCNAGNYGLAIMIGSFCSLFGYYLHKDLNGAWDEPHGE